MKKIISILLAACVLLSLGTAAFADAGMANFQRVRSYDKTFSDVPAKAWYADGVKNAYELGLMSGNGNGEFNPQGEITLRETVVIAAILHSTYYGNAIPEAEGAWYQKYVDYAVANSLIKATTDLTQSASRSQFAYILSKALPDKALPAINNISCIPDVSSDAWYYSGILKLYKAGVITGNDEYGFFHPGAAISRCAAASIAAKMADESLRASFTPKTTMTVYAADGSTKKIETADFLEQKQQGWYASPDDIPVVEAYSFSTKATRAAMATLSKVTDEKTIKTYGCTLSDTARSGIQSAIDAYGKIAVSFVMVDLFSGKAVSYNAEQSMYTASEIKAPYVFSVLCAGKPTDYNMFDTIKYSSNVAYKATCIKYGASVFTDYLKACGADQTTVFDNHFGESTSLDFAKMWTYAYNFFVSDMDTAAWARDTFQGTNNSALNQVLQQYTVYSKAGWIATTDYAHVYNNGGIILDGDHPYVISIMSRCAETAGIAPARKLAAALDVAHQEMTK